MVGKETWYKKGLPSTQEKASLYAVYKKGPVYPWTHHQMGLSSNRRFQHCVVVHCIPFEATLKNRVSISTTKKTHTKRRRFCGSQGPQESKRTPHAKRRASDESNVWRLLESRRQKPNQRLGLKNQNLVFQSGHTENNKLSTKIWSKTPKSPGVRFGGRSCTSTKWNPKNPRCLGSEKSTIQLHD